MGILRLCYRGVCKYYIIFIVVRQSGFGSNTINTSSNQQLHILIMVKIALLGAAGQIGTPLSLLCKQVSTSHDIISGYKRNIK